MKHVLVDFIVHGIGGPYENCDLFSFFDSRKKLLIEFNDDFNEFQDYSLSRCVPNDELSRSFHPEGFQMTLPTPGILNSCYDNGKKIVNSAFYLFECDPLPVEMSQSIRVKR